MNKPLVEYREVSGLSYKDVWELQTSLHKEGIARKIERRNDDSLPTPTNYLVFCEHKPVYTLGKSGSMDNLLLSQEVLSEKSYEFHKVNRGGDITYHGPGQITGYPILDLDQFYNDVHKYVRMLEEAIIQTMASFSINGVREDGYTGVWINDKQGKRKICAIGVHMSRWVTMHGFGLNVNTDLSKFNHIIPCGIIADDKKVTSMQQELGAEVDMDEVKILLKQNFKTLFNFEYK